MRLLDEHNAAAYLREAGRVGPAESLEVRFLSGGVSNVVLHIHRPEVAGGDFVLKQARPQLRVPDPWFCSVERIWREVAVLRLCEMRLGESGGGGPLSVCLPRILFEDREEFVFAMTAAPLGHATWKQRLLDGEVDASTAAACGRVLGRLHASTWRDPSIELEFADRQFFDDLRLDPYYRQIARVHAELASPVAKLLDSLSAHPRCLVHGDFSPKNLLVWTGGLMLIDCEVGHFGDPAFDLGFFLTHLALKSLHFAQRWMDYFTLIEGFWRAYRDTLAPVAGDAEWSTLERRVNHNWAACLLARVDGKSRVEYLTGNEAASVRELAKPLIAQPPATWDEMTVALRSAIATRLKHSRG
jgi:aminoglycoside phosphotransferase (APT) family kinase protein